MFTGQKILSTSNTLILDGQQANRKVFMDGAEKDARVLQGPGQTIAFNIIYVECQRNKAQGRATHRHHIGALQLSAP